MFFFFIQLDSKLSIAASHTSRYPNMSGEHEVVVIHGIYDASESVSKTWETDTRDKMSTNFEFVFMGIPDLRSVTGSSSQSIALLVQLFTNSRRPVYVPFFTDQVTYVDALSTRSDGTVYVRKDGDELILRLNDVGTGCPHDSCVKEDDFRVLRDSLWVTYPHPFTFDWSICEQIWSPVICQVIDSAVSSSPEEFCVSFHKIDQPRRCGTSIEIMKMTGIFREASLLIDQPPIESFEAERVEMPSHYHGLVAPCL